jgi:WD40 repeat protein
VSLAGGAPTVLADATHSHGLAWHPGEDAIYFAPHQLSPLWKVPAAGGSSPVQVTTLDSSLGELSHEWPIWSEDRNTLVFTVAANADYDEAQISFLTLSNGARETIRMSGEAFALTNRRELLFVRKRSVMSGLYDRGAVASPEIVKTPSGVSELDGRAMIGLSRSGTLVYVPSPDVRRRSLVSISADGSETDANFGRHEFQTLALSPDGRRVAIGIGDGPDSALYVADSTGGTLTLLTKPAGWAASWSPDGKWIAASMRMGHVSTISRLFLDASQKWEPLFTIEPTDVLGEWTPDGRGLLFSRRDSGTGRRSIRLLALDSKPPQISVVIEGEDATVVQHPSLSPDGRWLAYESNESGRAEVYVQRYPAPSGRLKVSRDGGGRPSWTKSGDEIYFASGGVFMASRVVTKYPELRFAPPRLIVNDPLIVPSGGSKRHDVAPDGGILAIREDDSVRSDHIVVVQNWLSEMRARSADGQK